MSEYPPPQDYSGQQPPQGYPPQPGYPPQDAAYPPQQQPGYPPPQQPGYPPQQPGYVPPGYPPQQQPAYPPQQQPGYPPQQPGYPPQQQPGYPPPASGGAPPPYYAPEPVQQQKTDTNVVVVTQQPTAYVTTVRSVSGDHYFTLSIVLTIICFFCGWWSLLCTIPAIFFAISAREADSRGDNASAASNARIALILNIVAVAWWIAAFFIIVLSSAVQ